MHQTGILSAIPFTKIANMDSMLNRVRVQMSCVCRLLPYSQSALRPATQSSCNDSTEVICVPKELCSAAVKAAAAAHTLGLSVQVVEAQLTLLLRLSSARRSSRAEVTDDVNVIGKLVHCKVCCLPLSLI